MDQAWRRRLTRMLAAISALLGVNSAQAGPEESEFARLLAAAVENPSAADFRRLRTAYVRSPEYDPYAEPFDPGPVRQEVENGERVAALLALDRVLKGRWMDVDAHLFAAMACQRLGETERAERHIAFHRGLLRAILDAGDGRGYETAWPVVRLAEEYHIVLVVLDLEPESQALVEHEGHRFDVLTVKDPRTGDTSDLYFNIDAPHRWLAEDAARRAGGR